MPYNPGIQDISGQLIAQGQSQANAARARAIESLGQSFAQFAGTLTTGMKQYQQNQFLTKQAMGKFGAQLEDPNFKKYVAGVLADDPNSPTVPEPLKKALQNAQKGDVDIYDAALLGGFADSYQDNLRGQLLRAQAEATKPKMPEGQIMSMGEYQALIAAYPNVDFGAKVLSDGRVAVQAGGARAPAAPEQPQMVPLGGGVGGFRRGVLESFTPNVPAGTMPTNLSELTMRFGQAPAQAAQAIPPGLSRFQGAAQAPAGPMAALGQFAGAPRAAAPAPAPAPTAAPAGQGLEFKPIPGSEQAAKAASEVKLKENRFNSALESMDVQLGALDRIIPEISGRTTGWGSLLQYVPGTKAKQMAADLLPVRAQEAFTGITQLKEAGGSLGQVAIYEVKLLENRRAAIDQATSAEDFNNRVREFRAQVQKSKLNLIRARDRDLGLTEPSEDYLKAGGTRQNFLGIQEDEAQDGRENVRKLQIRRGSEPGTSTLGSSQPVFDAAFEGMIVRDKQSGKRYRVVNGKGVVIE